MTFRSKNHLDTLTNYYEYHHEELVAYAAKVLHGDRMRAEDVVQNTFLRLLCNTQFITPVTLPSLVYTSLRHQLCDLCRQLQCRQLHNRLYSTLYVADSVESAASRIEARQMIDLIDRRINRLGEKAAKVLRLCIIEQRPVSEIAELLSLKYKTAEHLLGQGRKVIRPYAKRLLA